MFNVEEYNGTGWGSTGDYYNPYPYQPDSVCPGCGYCRCCGRYIGPRWPDTVWCGEISGTGTTNVDFTEMDAYEHGYYTGDQI